MPEKTFTLEEANVLLPVLESLLKRAMASKRTIEEVDHESQALNYRIFLNGGTSVDIVRAAARKSERERAVQQIKDDVTEIAATGVQVKDLEIGLLDFPCLVNGETVLLCWKLGEAHKIEHWHGMSEGFAGRKPIAMLDLDAGRKRKQNPERPN